LETRAGAPRALVRELARRSVVLAVLALPLLAATWRVSAARPLGGLGLGLYVAVAGLLVVCEHWLAFDDAWGSALGGSPTDFAYVVVATVMDKATFVVCVGAIASVGAALAARLGVDLWPHGWSIGLQIGLALLVADAATYLRHRLSHASSVLWRFHRIHHSMTELYWIRSAYTHPLEQLFILTAIMVPISLLGAPDQVVAVVAFVFGLSGLLQHANVDTRSSVLNRIFATPEVHRIHHGADAGSHTNFSAFFVFMDLLFGTYDPPPAASARLRVGLEDAHAFPRGFLAQLVAPFRGEDAWERGHGRTAPVSES
jgi:ornithine lipid hydroxylase